ncbi:ADP-ribosylation factor [Metarhizium album ARSEF 1941]|uniref:ADP-ribosylation factor n=1 Tax=Metarhizium album (strain ARSEF 1941) TaxID=1081103 RepID=A0A0B2X2V3_METAS|nr:ADP-ribosylation factor [Metarhizium album ARSEF 1941]KHN99620.1 ADP-ribosylation factor [Metarhizium album ARSEF 1941]
MGEKLLAAQGLRVCARDVGGQKTLRSYWRNYFEKTDALIWVVDATDRLRMDDCRDELHGLLLEETGLHCDLFGGWRQHMAHGARRPADHPLGIIQRLAQRNGTRRGAGLVGHCEWRRGLQNPPTIQHLSGPLVRPRNRLGSQTPLGLSANCNPQTCITKVNIGFHAHAGAPTISIICTTRTRRSFNLATGSLVQIPASLFLLVVYECHGLKRHTATAIDNSSPHRSTTTRKEKDMSDEVSQFLEQVERLRGQQIEDDEARAREREEFLAAKRERQARREERARSISPQKSSPANTPSPRSSRRSFQVPDVTRLDSPSRTSASLPVGEDSMTPPGPPARDGKTAVEPDTRPIESSTSPMRTPTLSWQKRPASRGGARPLNVVAAQNATQRSLAGSQEPASATEESFSKDQIARALGSKDPSWFRQTADRGQSSAAFRRSQVEDEDRLDMSSVSAQLQGLSPANPISSSTSFHSPKHSPEPPSHSRLASPVALNFPRLDGATDEMQPSQESAPLSGRASPNRSPSPTKGLGGFVQSAMMKRSDSVKRWSVASPPGLTRADSAAAMRSARSSVHLGSSPHSTVRGDSTPTARPTSQHGDKPSELASISKSSSQMSIDASRGVEKDGDAGIPSSPSKTMDPRRWSPTKSSWLENALNRPESPKPSWTTSQPTWRNTANAESSRPTSVSHKHQVSIGGLMRQSAVGNVAKSNPTGLGGIYSPPPNANRPAYGHGSKPSITQRQSEPDSSKPDKMADGEGVKQAEEGISSASATKQMPVTSPPHLKPRPQTPPTTDFRSNLRQRPAEKEDPKSGEPEFKNVFGNLRKTKTQNYVAPDELRNNILRGKSALNVTDGPKRGERKDEFKDAILKKRADFKAAQSEGRGVTRTSSTAAEKHLPEGLAKRAELGKSVAAMAKKSDVPEIPTVTPTQKEDSQKPVTGPKRVPSGSAFSPKPPNAALRPETSPGTEKLRRVSTEPEAARTKTEPRATATLQKETSAPSKLAAHSRAGGGKLADRFNPGLAGMLARGPPPMATNGGRSCDETGDDNAKSSSGNAIEAPAPGPQLTHMTKGRARGPKRKAPTVAAASALSQTASQPPPAIAEAVKESKAAVQELPANEPGTEHGSANPAALDEKPTTPPVARPLESEASLEPAARPASRGRPLPLVPRPSASSSPAKASPQPEQEAFAATSPKKEDAKQIPRFLDENSSQDAQKDPATEPAWLRYRRAGSRSPTKLAEPPSPTKSDRDSLPSMRETSPRSPRFGVRSVPTSIPPLDEPVSPGGGPDRRVRPLSGLSGDGYKSPAATVSPARSPTKQTNEVSALLTRFFGPPQTRQAIKVDPAQILMNRPDTGDKVTSLGLQMFQILGDGKKLPVSPQNERVLFDQEMYVCAHNLINGAGKKVLEAYFWVGDEVPEASAEDAQLFVQREARSLGGKLVKFQQGKETAEFVQALGGVIIVRRGSSNKYDSLAPSMLCGRRYLGQVAFDEVDFTPSSLCTGFTYLVAKGGTCYIWKGKGGDVAEVSCARLVGMDMTLTGELIEYEDGNEPQSFWHLFEDNSPKPHSADHWRLKPNYEKYCSRLFCSDADSGQQVLNLRANQPVEIQIIELSPFSQMDLRPTNIYILDAFFEMYIIVGSHANNQYASFRNALDFAQEYAILASGMEDRPFVPVSTVVLEGIPRDLKRVFRKWDEGRSPTVMNASAGLKRGRSLRVVTLTQALLALGE